MAPTRTGIVRLAGSGQELFGTVVEHGVNPKTVKVRVSAKNWCNKYKIYLYSNKTKHVHD